MMGIPSDPHLQTEDSRVGTSVAEAATTDAAFLPHADGVPDESTLELSRPEDQQERYADLQDRHTRALARTAELERHLSAQRVEISRWSNHLRAERTRLIKEIEAFRWRGANDMRWRLCLEVEERIARSDSRQRICNFIQQPYIDMERSFCQLVDKMRRKYPMYQMRSTDTLAEAIDSLVCTAEVCLEDKHLVNMAIASTRRRTDELRERNRKLVEQIERLERTLRSAGRSRSGYTALPAPDDATAGREEAERETDDTGRASDTSGAGSMADSNAAAPQMGHARRNVLALRLDTVRSRHNGSAA